MIHPSPAEILESLSEVFEKVLIPGIKAESSGEKSANLKKHTLSNAITVGHFLRYINIRLECEEAQLRDEISMVEPMAKDTCRFLMQHDQADSGALVSRIEQACLQVGGDQEVPMTINELREAAASVRSVLQDVVKRLVQLRGTFGEQLEYQSLRSALRDYMGRQLMNESAIVDRAFAGRGYRR